MNQLLEFVRENTLLAAATVAMLLAVIFNELRLKASGLTAVPATQAVRLINAGARVIDIRDKEQYDHGHIVDAINVPAEDLAQDPAKKLKKAKSAVLVCDTGARSGKMVATLRKQGTENLFSLQGGLGAWQRENLPIVPTDQS